MSQTTSTNDEFNHEWIIQHKDIPTVSRIELIENMVELKIIIENLKNCVLENMA